MAKKNTPTIRLPQPIDLRFKCVRGFWGKNKIVLTSPGEQKRLKKAILKIFPDNLFYDELQEENSVDTPYESRCMQPLKQPIDLRYRYKKNIFRQRIQVATSPAEQSKIKKAFLKIFPDALFYDALGETNSRRMHTGRNLGEEAADIAYDLAEYSLAMALFEKVFDSRDDYDYDFDNDDIDDKADDDYDYDSNDDDDSNDDGYDCDDDVDDYDDYDD